MEYSIDHRPVFTTLTIKLASGESIRAESGAMISMSPNIDLKSKKQGKGLGGMFKAAIGGEGFFASQYTAQDGPGEVVFAPGVPGDIMSFNMGSKIIYAQSGAYIAGSEELELSSKGSLKALISGEGLFLQKISGNGRVFLNSYGAVYEKALADGEHYIVDNGHLVAFEESVNYTFKKAAKGLFSTFVSGEGIVCDFCGPGKIWLQTRNLKGFAELIYKLMPKQGR